MYIYSIIIFSLLFLSSCAIDKAAPIEHHYNKPVVNKSINYSNKTIDKFDQENISGSILKVDSLIEPTSVFKEEDREMEEIGQLNALDNSKVIYHDVIAGENLVTIARNYNQTVEQIAQLNNLNPGDQLSEFQIVKIKVSKDFLNQKNLEKEDIQDIDTKHLHTTRSYDNAAYVWPVSNGHISTKFGEVNKGQKSKGINIEAIKGTGVLAIGDGQVVYTSTDSKFGNLVIIKLDNSDIYAAYAYMDDLIMKKGSRVLKEEIIGHVGETGKTTKPQLYFALRKGTEAVDPEKYFNLNQ